MITDEKFCDRVHMNIHAVRLLKNYKPSEFEKNISELVLDKFSSTCSECAEALNRKQNTPQQKSFLDKLKGVLNE